MEIKLDKSVEDAINSNYQIEPSIFREIEQRRQSSEAAQTSIKNTLSLAPTKPKPPEESTSATTQIINNANYDIKLKDNQLNSILELLSLLDVSIDKVDNLIKKLDSEALTLINEINTEIKNVEIAYNKRIQEGCRSNLIWSFIGTSTGYDGIAATTRILSNYTVIEDSSQQVILNNYGLKYYQKPSNRDYGFNIVSEFNGSILVGSNTLTIATSSEISGIQIGDEITDNLTSPEAFNIGSLPKVVSFGTTSVIGIKTTIIGNTNLGSNIIAYSGIGVTENISIGDYVISEGLFETNTQVVGFGTTTTTIVYNDVGLSTFVTTNLTVPGIIVSSVSSDSISNTTIGFGSYETYSSIILSNQSNITIVNKTFTAIRQTEDITNNFDYTNNPIDPITIGIIDNSRVGIGYKIEFINNGHPTGPSQWRQVLDDNEPDVGAGNISYYTGTQLWPYDFLYGYAIKGAIYNFNSELPPTYVAISPTGKNLNGAICNGYNSDIITAENKLQNVIDKNLPQIQKLLSASIPLRKSRDTDEMQAWAYLQSASYLRSGKNNLNSDINSLNGFDYNSL